MRSSCSYPFTLLAACPVVYRLMHTFSVLVENVSVNQFVPGKERSWSPFGHLCCNVIPTARKRSRQNVFLLKKKISFRP